MKNTKEEERRKQKEKTKKQAQPLYLHRVLQSTVDGPQGPLKQHSCRAVRASAFQKQQTTGTGDGEGAVVDPNLHRQAVKVRVQIHVIDMNSLDDLILVFVHSPHVVRKRMLPVRRCRRWRRWRRWRQVNGGSVVDGVDQKSDGQGRRAVQCIVQCRPFSSSLWRQSNSKSTKSTKYIPKKTLI